MKMEVFAKILLSLITVCAVYGCSESDEPIGIPGIAPRYYYISISDETGADLLDPENAQCVANEISFVVDNKTVPVYVQPEENPAIRVCGIVDKADFHDCWTLRIGGFEVYAERTYNMVLTVRGAKYGLKVVVYYDYRTEDFKVITPAFYINGELMDTTFPQDPIQFTLR